MEVTVSERGAPEDLEVLHSAYAAFGRRDWPALLDALDPWIEWEAPEGSPMAGVYHGHEEVLLNVLGILPEAEDAFRIDAEHWLDLDGIVLVVGRYRGRPPDGPRFSIPFVHVWAMRDGIAIRFRSHVDGRRLTEVLAR